MSTYYRNVSMGGFGCPGITTAEHAELLELAGTLDTIPRRYSERKTRK